MGRTTRISMVMALAAVLLGMPADARVESNSIAHIAFDVPDDWQTTSQGAMVVVRPPAGGMALEVHFVNSMAQVRSEVASFEQTLQTRFQGAQFDGPARQVTQNGLSGELRLGRATSNAQPVRFFHGFLGNARGGVYFIGFVTGQGSLGNFHVLQEVLNTFRPSP